MRILILPAMLLALIGCGESVTIAENNACQEMCRTLARISGEAHSYSDLKHVGRSVVCRCHEPRGVGAK